MIHADTRQASGAARQQQPALSDDLIQGTTAIAAFIGLKPRTVYHLAQSGRLRGAFQIGRIWCARRSTLLENIRKLEQGAN
jgi:hypothetical protein